MKIKVNEASGVQLDWMVATCEGFVSEDVWEGDEVWMENPNGRCGYSANFDYSRNWELGGPLIERAGLHLRKSGCEWQCDYWNDATLNFDTSYGPTPLIAAMRCFVVSRLGEEIEIPEELK